VPAVAALSARCLAAYGGLPVAADENFVARRYTGQGVRSRGAFDPSGLLVASAAVRPDPDNRVAATATAQVDPEHTGQGLGGNLLDWCLGGPSWPPGVSQVAVETESLHPATERLFASRSLVRVFAEDTMRADLTGAPPEVPLPAGFSLVDWSAATAGRFFAVYQAAFRDRPGFPGWPEHRWIEWIAGDAEFRPQWTMLAVDPTGDAGFVACAEGWIVQVGVPPPWRGRQLGAALVVEALRRMRAAGRTEAWLDVHVDNPARQLYVRLGFTVIGRRGKYKPSV